LARDFETDSLVWVLGSVLAKELAIVVILHLPAQMDFDLASPLAPDLVLSLPRIPDMVMDPFLFFGLKIMLLLNV
jgi:hypothetical protein